MWTRDVLCGVEGTRTLDAPAPPSGDRSRIYVPLTTVLHFLGPPELLFFCSAKLRSTPCQPFSLAGDTR